jgi:hypothetical protein
MSQAEIQTGRLSQGNQMRNDLNQLNFLRGLLNEPIQRRNVGSETNWKGFGRSHCGIC